MRNTYFEQSQCPDRVLLIEREAMINTGREDKQVTCIHRATDPFIVPVCESMLSQTA